MVVPEDEKELIVAAQRGDNRAFASLMKEHQKLIYAMIYRQVGDADVAEELAQESFIKAYRGLKRFRGDCKVSSWLVRIALNQTNSYFRSRRYKQYVRNEQLDAARAIPTDQSGEQELLQRQRLEQFRRAIASLKPHYREVLVLCGLEGKSYDEAASIMDIPVGTVRSRLNKARLLAREALTREELRI